MGSFSCVHFHCFTPVISNNQRDAHDSPARNFRRAVLILKSNPLAPPETELNPARAHPFIILGASDNGARLMDLIVTEI